MAKKIKMKEILFHISDDIESVNNNIKRQNLKFEEQNKINKDRLKWEQETKDRVDISLKEYEEMKRKIAVLEEQNEKYKTAFDRIGAKEWVDSIEPSSIEVATMKDPIRLSTRVHIQFESKRYEHYF